VVHPKGITHDRKDHGDKQSGEREGGKKRKSATKKVTSPWLRVPATKCKGRERTRTK